MRTILSISFPADKAAKMKKKAKRAGLTPSAYLLRLYLNEEHLITEDELLQYAKEAEDDLKHGRCTVLKTKADIKRYFGSK